MAEARKQVWLAAFGAAYAQAFEEHTGRNDREQLAKRHAETVAKFAASAYDELEDTISKLEATLKAVDKRNEALMELLLCEYQERYDYLEAVDRIQKVLKEYGV